jgi:tRNA pseudouridine38-40 synthase
MRWFAQISYNGANYCGWQTQIGSLSIQETIQTALSTILRQQIEILGCGRTDAGVHASDFFFHFDFDQAFPNQFLSRINKFLPKDIAIHQLFLMHDNAHARFDAIKRTYIYKLTFKKNPFEQDTLSFIPSPLYPDLELMKQAAELITNYSDFYPFSKSKSDVKTFKCKINHSEWVKIADDLIYTISADRFLRGMVRLIVGMCLNVGWGKLTLEDVKNSMENQTRIFNSFSAPPNGLFLSSIEYPYRLNPYFV